MRRILWQSMEWQAVLGRLVADSNEGDEFVVPTEERKAEALPLFADILQEGTYTVVVDAATCAAEEARVREIRSHAKVPSFTDPTGYQYRRGAFAQGEYAEGAPPPAPVPAEIEETDLPPEDPQADLTRFDTSWARTGRLSSARPNLSNQRRTPLLKTETDTPQMQARILRVFLSMETMANGDPYLEKEVQVDFEHGQWWITVKPTGAQWSVCDGTGPSAIDGFVFERVTEGECDE